MTASSPSASTGARAATAGAQVFLSFKSGERDVAARLKDALVASGFSVWWQEDIQCGREWHGDIDAALSTAGCVVVVWSAASLQSPWVRHEASQAIARRVYAPVRLEPFEIGSPYDRLQASDLFNWTGDVNHPGFQNLLKRVRELLPPPVPPLRRTTRFVRRNLWTIGLGVFAAAAVAMLANLGISLQGQIEAQQAIAYDVQRSLHPLDSFIVRAQLILDPAMPGVQQFVQSLRDSVFESPGRSSARRSLPRGVSTADLADGAVYSVSVLPQSPLWPRRDTHLLASAVDGCGLLFTFRRPITGDPRSSREATFGGDGDLSFTVGSNDVDTKESIEWNARSNTLFLILSTTRSKHSWMSNQQILSVPDVERSSLTVSIESDDYDVTDEPTKTAILSSRGHMRLETLWLTYAERTVELTGAKAAEAIDKTGLRSYTMEMSGPASRRLR